MIQWCKNCVLPNTRPNLIILDNGICNACYFHKKRKNIDWKDKKRILNKIFYKILRLSKSNYDCLIPVSGGKDSTWQVIECLKNGLNPLAITYKTPGRNSYGDSNLKNLISLGVDHIDYTINPRVEAYFMLKTLRLKGSTAIPMHLAIFNLPQIIAEKFNIPLIVWGENSASEYGGYINIKEAKNTMSDQWIKKYGVTNKTNHNYWKDHFLNDKKLFAFRPLKKSNKVLSIFLGEYIKWDPKKILRIVKKSNFIHPKFPKTGFYNYADIDCNFISIHHYLKWLKFGFTRLFDNLSIEIRNQRLSRKQAINIIKKNYNNIKPEKDIEIFCKFTNISLKKFDKICEKFRDKSIWKKNKNQKWYIENFLTNDFNWK